MRSPHFSTLPLAALPLVALVAGCTVGPDYQAPQTRLSDAWVASAAPGEAADGRWWATLGDPLLDTLMDEMLAGNPDLREAQARLAEARANRDAVRGGRLPQAQIAASGSETVLSKNGQIPVGNIPGFSREFGLFDLGFDASWEIDLWGRRTRQIEAAQARADQAGMAAQGARLQLTAELARAYVELRLAQSEAGLAAEVAQAQHRLADLTALRVRAGEASRLEAELAASDAQGARAALENAQAMARDAALRVAVLVGARPEAMLPRLEGATQQGSAGAIPLPPQAIAAGLPADLLRRRPDIRAAERDLAAATADVGVATADLFPRLSLGLAIGQQARAIGDLLDGDSTRLQAGPSLAWPLFSGGTTRARVRAAGARVDQAAARYDAAIIAALADSEGAINRFDRALAAYQAAQVAQACDATVFDLAARRSARGEDDQLALARARLTFVAARQRAEQARAAAVNAAIGLHKALGGGWDGRAG